MIKKSDILTELRANPDKIFHLLRENDFERAIKLWGYSGRCASCGRGIEKLCGHRNVPLISNYIYHLKKLILAPDVLGYLESYGKEGE